MLRILLSLSLILAQLPSYASKSYLSNFDLGNRPSEYIIQNFPDQRLISVRLLGGVKKPGIYRIPKKTSLLTLLTYSGGLAADADPEALTISGQETRTISVEKLLKNPKNDFMVKENQTIFIENKEPLVNQDTLVVVGLVSTGVSLLLSVYLATR